MIQDLYLLLLGSYLRVLTDTGIVHVHVYVIIYLIVCGLMEWNSICIVSLDIQISKNANEAKNERNLHTNDTKNANETKNERKIHTNDTKNARYTKRIHETNARYTNKGNETNELYGKRKRTNARYTKRTHDTRT
jgi:hypothetical protein